MSKAQWQALTKAQIEYIHPGTLVPGTSFEDMSRFTAMITLKQIPYFTDIQMSQMLGHGLAQYMSLDQISAITIEQITGNYTVGTKPFVPQYPGKGLADFALKQLSTEQRAIIDKKIADNTK